MPAMPNRWKPNVTVAALIEWEGALLVEEETGDGLKLNNPAGHLDPGDHRAGLRPRGAGRNRARFCAPALVGVYLNRFVKTRTATT